MVMRGRTHGAATAGDRARTVVHARRPAPLRARADPAVDQVLMLQRTVGNLALTQAFEEGGQLVRWLFGLPPAAPAAPVAPPPKVDWIESLPAYIRQQIDLFSDEQFGKQTAEKQQQLLEKRQQNRVTFVENMRCYFGTDAAVQAHFSNIVQFEGTQLWVHSSVADRLRKVKTAMEAQGVPMPSTTVGQALRGRHLHPKGKGPGRGMMSHAAGFAVDWHAYRNPHIVDPRIHALIEAVTGGPPAMHLGLGEGAGREELTYSSRRKLIREMGQGKADPGRERQLLESIEKEYLRLEKGSTEFKASLPQGHIDELRSLLELRAKAEGKQAIYLARVKQGKKAKPEDVEAARLAAEQAAEEYEAKLQDVQSGLEQIFAPWLEKIAKAIVDIEDAAQAMGVDIRTEVTTEPTLKGLRAKEAELAKAQAPHRKASRSLAASVGKLETELTMIQTRLEAARPYLDKVRPEGAGAPVPKGRKGPTLEQWNELDQAVTELTPLARQRAEQAHAIRAYILESTFGPTARPKAPAMGTPKARSVTKNELDVWRSRLAASEAEIVAFDERWSEAETLQAQAAHEHETVRLDRMTREQLNEATRKKVGKPKFAELQDKKAKLYWLEETAKALKEDMTFIFKPRDVRDPGVTQLLGILPATEGGGFFGPDKPGGAAAAAAGKMSSEHGFNLLFFQTMARHGFDLGASWEQSPDTMHFELVEAVEQLGTTGACKA